MNIDETEIMHDKQERDKEGEASEVIVSLLSSQTDN